MVFYNKNYKVYPLELFNPVKKMNAKIMAKSNLAKKLIGTNQHPMKPTTPKNTAIALPLIIELCSAFIILKTSYLV